MLEQLTWLYFIILALASFRLTHLLVYDDITDPLRKLFMTRQLLTDEQGNQQIIIEPRGKGLRRWLGLMLTCHWCTGIWSAILLTLLFLFVPWTIWLLVILAAAGVAAIIESLVLRL